MENKKKKKFKLFDMNRDGKGVEKVEEGPKNFVNFFKLCFRKFSRLLSVNLILIFLVLPIIICIAIYIMGPTTASSGSPLFPTLYGASFMSDSPTADIQMALNSIQLAVPVHNSYVYYVIAAIAVVYVFTFGWQNVAGTYLARSLVRGDPVFVISDFFYAIKKNWRQGLIVGLLDCLCIAVLAVDFMYFYYQTGSFRLDLMYAVTVALIFIYYTMRFYIYMQMITFDISIWKMIKNSLIFTALGIKRNLLAILGIVVLAAVNVILALLLFPLKIILPLILPLFYFIGTVFFIKAYAAYPVIEKYMIDPVVNKKDGGENGSDSSDDTGSTDDSDKDDPGDGDVEVPADNMITEH